MSKGNETLGSRIEGIAGVIEAVQERPKAYQNIEPIEEQLNESETEVEQELMFWKTTKNNVKFWGKLKAQRRIRYFEKCKKRINNLLKQYSELVKIRNS